MMIVQQRNSLTTLRGSTWNWQPETWSILRRAQAVFCPAPSMSILLRQSTTRTSTHLALWLPMGPSAPPSWRSTSSIPLSPWFLTLAEPSVSLSASPSQCFGITLNCSPPVSRILPSEHVCSKLLLFQFNNSKRCQLLPLETKRLLGLLCKFRK